MQTVNSPNKIMLDFGSKSKAAKKPNGKKLGSSAVFRFDERDIRAYQIAVRLGDIFVVDLPGAVASPDSTNRAQSQLQTDVDKSSFVYAAHSETLFWLGSLCLMSTVFSWVLLRIFGPESIVKDEFTVIAVAVLLGLTSLPLLVSLFLIVNIAFNTLRCRCAKSRACDIEAVGSEAPPLPPPSIRTDSDAVLY